MGDINPVYSRVLILTSTRTGDLTRERKDGSILRLADNASAVGGNGYVRFDLIDQFRRILLRW